MKRLFFVCIAVAVARLALAGAPGCVTENGDNNADGGIDLSDAVYILAHLFQGGAAPEDFCFAVGPKEPGCADISGDVNGDGGNDLSDAIYSLSFSFQGGPAPVVGCELVGPQPEVCDDNMDNDMDGDTDCLDADCDGVSPQVVYNFDSGVENWQPQESQSDLTVAWDNGELVVTYEEAAGSPHPPEEQLDYPGIRVPAGHIDPGIDNDQITHMIIDYDAVNWPTENPVTCFMGYNNGSVGGALQFQLDPILKQAVVEFAAATVAVQPAWGAMADDIVGINIEFPYGAVPAASPASDWYDNNASLRIQRIAFNTSSESAPCPPPPPVEPPVEVCTGGVDEDLDGLTDCADADCPDPSQLVYTFDADLEGWTAAEAIGDTTVAWTNGDGELVMTYAENAGSPNDESGVLNYAGCRTPRGSISPGIDTSVITHVSIDYEAVNWPSSNTVRCAIGYISGTEGAPAFAGVSEFALDPDATQVVIDLNTAQVFSQLAWSLGGANLVTGINFEIPLGLDPSATPASDWYSAGATLRIDRIAFTSVSCP